MKDNRFVDSDNIFFVKNLYLNRSLLFTLY